VKEFLEIPEFRETKGYGKDSYQNLRRVFRLSTSVSFAKLLAEVARLNTKGNYRYHVAAEGMARASGKRFVVFGHTHAPTMEPLFTRNDQSVFYVNTGCWRRVVSRPSGTDDESFVPRRLTCYFRAEEAPTVPETESHHLVQEWHAI
jgi:UDP-2,3-diacylglucosamine pyrophosphatase LpxH